MITVSSCGSSASSSPTKLDNPIPQNPGNPQVRRSNGSRPKKKYYAMNINPQLLRNQQIPQQMGQRLSETCENAIKRMYADDTDIRKAEIRICLDMVEHGRDPEYSLHNMQLYKSIFRNTKLSENLSLDANKIWAIVINVINRSIVLDTVKMLKDKYFSLLIRERDIADAITLCILVRYVHKGEIKTHILDHIATDEPIETNLIPILKHATSQFCLSYSNLIGVCIDEPDRFPDLMKKKGISILNYNCMADVADRAFAAFPQKIDDLFDYIYCYTWDCNDYPDLKKVHESMHRHRRRTPSIKFLRHIYAERIQRDWVALYWYFDKTVEDPRTRIVSKIMKYPLLEAYLEFLAFIVPFIISFKMENIQIHRLIPESKRFLRLLGMKFLEHSCLTDDDILRVDINDKKNLLPFVDIDIGVGATGVLRRSEVAGDNEKKDQFYEKVQKYYTIAFTESVKRLPLNDKLLAALKFLEPDVALDPSKNERVNLDPVINKFKSKFANIRMTTKHEWKMFPIFFLGEEKSELLSLDIVKFWDEMSRVKNIQDKLQFKNISSLALLCLSLPYSNADVDKYFSTFEETTKEMGNKLRTEKISAVTRIKFDLWKKNKDCCHYDVTKEMLEFHRSNLHSKKIIPEDLKAIILSDRSDDGDNDSSES